ncbi:MAG: hypothetical protein N2255_08330 [Kiritimatiellae bacterium]|nr:hypothetical protein [Kiritimatiellia bacterium]
MNTGLHPSVAVLREGFERLRYVLPRRTIGKAKWIGMPVALFGLADLAFSTLWMYLVIRMGFQVPGGIRWAPIVLGLFGLPFAFVGLGLFAAGIGILFNGFHTELVVTTKHLTVVERFGFLRWTARCRLGDIRRFVLKKGVEPWTSELRSFYLMFRDLPLLVAETTRGRTLWIAPGYDSELLRSLARALAEAVEACGEDFVRGVEQGTQRVILDGAASESPEQPPLSKPPKSRIIFQKLADGLAISVPPAGLLKGTHGLFVFGVLWTVFALTIVPAVLRSATSSPHKPGVQPGLWVLFSIFLLAGVLVLLVSINIGRRRVLIVVGRDSLGYRLIAPFGRREEIVKFPDIVSIAVGPSGIKVNNRPIPELQITLKNGKKKLGLLSQCSEEELEWLAEVLRRAVSSGGDGSPTRMAQGPQARGAAPRSATRPGPE